MRIITFSKFDAHSSPIFKYLTIIKLPDLYVLNIAIFMHKFHHKKLPSAFNHYFTTVNEIHAYNTRLASKQSYSLPKTRTNFGIFNIRYQGPKIWNSLDESDKKLLDFQLKKKLKIQFIDSYWILQLFYLIHKDIFCSAVSFHSVSLYLCVCVCSVTDR